MRVVAAAPVVLAAVVDRAMMGQVTASAMKIRLIAPGDYEDGGSPIARWNRPHKRLYTRRRIV